MWQKLVIASVIMANEAGVYVSGQAESGVKNMGLENVGLEQDLFGNRKES